MSHRPAMQDEDQLEWTGREVTAISAYIFLHQNVYSITLSEDGNSMIHFRKTR